MSTFDYDPDGADAWIFRQGTHGHNPYDIGSGFVDSAYRGSLGRLPKAQVRRWYWSDGIRMVTVTCPFCKGDHDHVVPLDITPDARLRRTSKCPGRRPKRDYRLVLPEGGMTPGMDPIDAGKALVEVMDDPAVDLTFSDQRMLLEIWTQTPGMERAKLLGGAA